MKTKPQLAGLAVISSLIIHPPSASAQPLVTGIACGASHSLFRKSDGSLWGMGSNAREQLGTNFSLFSAVLVPTEIVSNGVTAVAAGLTHSLFRLGPSLWGMGFYVYSSGIGGDLGDYLSSNAPIFTGSGGTSVTLIAGGAEHSLFGTSGFVVGATGFKTMGQNVFGQLGDGTFTNRTTPKQIVSAGMLAAAGGGSHSLFVRTDGSLWGMGANNFAQLGLGTTFSTTNRQVEIVSSGVAAVAAGNQHSLFIKSDSSLWGMGDNTSGLLGDSNPTNHLVPVQIVASNVVAVATGPGHSLFIKSDGSLWGMGTNNIGQLGDGGSNTFYLSPHLIVGASRPVPFITAVSLSRTNLSLAGTNGAAGEKLFTLMSTNLAQPLIQWQPVATNVLSASGNFSLTATNVAPPGTAQRFFILKAQ